MQLDNEAAAAADDFLGLLTAQRHAEAWDALTPRTRTEAYGDDPEAFARDVVSADWSTLSWRIGPVVDYEISWGVFVQVDGGEAPAFLVERHLAAGSTDRLVLLVQLHTDGSYSIAGQGMDVAP